MSVNRWKGDAPAVAQVTTFTVGGTPAGGDWVAVTFNGKVTRYTVSGTPTTAAVAAGLQSLLANSPIPEVGDAQWSVAGSVVTGVAASAGVPFAATASDSGGATTLTAATPTASAGPSHVDLGANWSANHFPTTGEDGLVDGAGAPLLYGWENVTAAAVASIRIKASFENKAVGLPYWNPKGYVEYRGRGWPVGTTVPVTVGEGDGAGPSLVNLYQTTALALTVLKTGSRATPTVPVVNVSGAASGTLNLVGGDVGIAADDDTLSATVTTATVNDGATLTVGRGATVTTLNHDGGATAAPGAVTTLNIVGGTAVLYTAPTTVTADGGTVDCRFTGTAATMTFRGQGPNASPTCECGNDLRGRTFTDHTFTGGAILRDPDKTLTFTNAGTWDRASVAAADFGARFSLKRT